MLISELLEGIRGDFRSLSELGGPEVIELAERLGTALEPSLRTNFLAALNLLVQEYNLTSPQPLTLNLEGDDIHLVALVTSADDTTTASPSDYSARIALRLSDDLKESIEHLATDVGSSVNSWIVRSLERSVRTDTSSAPVRGARQLRGKGRA